MCGVYDAKILAAADAGVDCFRFDQPEVCDTAWLSDRLRRHTAALRSPVDIQKILPTGDEKTVLAGTERMLDTFDGFLICKDYPDLHGIGVRAE